MGFWWRWGREWGREGGRRGCVLGDREDWS